MFDLEMSGQFLYWDYKMIHQTEIIYVADFGGLEAKAYIRIMDIFGGGCRPKFGALIHTNTVG